MAKTYLDRTLSELEEELLQTSIKASKKSPVAANTVRAILTDIRSREQAEEDAATEAERQQKAARRRPELLNPRNRILAAMRIYQVIAETGKSEVARVQAQKAVDDCLRQLDALDAPEERKLLTDMEPEELEEYFTNLFASLDDYHLDLAMTEWCSRTGALVLVEGDRVVVKAAG